ncbi:MAG: hypothetical protein HGB08_03970 [Candidatus Moranbacteria bacterium]|nr:hypothetical protein [Candidatus Moranbacteria bacterium]
MARKRNLRLNEMKSRNATENSAIDGEPAKPGSLELKKNELPEDNKQEPQEEKPEDSYPDNQEEMKRQWLEDFSRGPVADNSDEKPRESMSKEEWLRKFSGISDDGEFTGKNMEDNNKDKPVDSEAVGEKSEAEKRAEELEMLRQNVESTRAAYAAKDLEMSRKLSMMNRVLRYVKTTSETLAGTTDEYNQYQAALNALISFQVESLRSKYDGIESKSQAGKIATGTEAEDEIGKLIMYFKLEENNNLFDARTRAKSDLKADEDGKDKSWKDKVWERGVQVVEWYKKLPREQKVAASAGIFAIGLGAGFAGVASVATVAGVARFGQKIIGGAAAGVGIAETQKNMRRLSDAKKAEKEKNKMLEELAKMDVNDLEGKFNVLAGSLRNEIKTYDESLKREVRKSGSRKAIGWIVGGAIGASAIFQVVNGLGLNADHAVKAGMPKLHPSHDGAMKPEIQGGVHGTETPGVKPGPGAKEIYSKLKEYDIRNHGHGARLPDGSYQAPDLQSDSPIHSGIPKVPESGPGIASTAEIPKGAEITIGKGGSIERNLIKHLTSQGVSKEEAGRRAHRMAVEFAQKHDLPKGAFSLVHEGTKIHLTPDGKGIMGITGDKHLGWIEKGADGKPYFSFATPDEKAAAGIHDGAPNNAGVGNHYIETGEVHGKIMGMDVEDVNRIDGQFGLSGSVGRDIYRYHEVSGKINNILSHNPGIEKTDINAMRIQLGEIDQKIVSEHALHGDSAELDRLTDAKMSMEENIRAKAVMLRLKEYHNQLIKKMFSRYRISMLGDNTRIGSFQQMQNITAKELFDDPVSNGSGEKVIGVYRSLLAAPGGKVFEPKDGERLSSWTTRVIGMIMKSKGIQLQ